MPRQHIYNWSRAFEAAKKARDKDYGFVLDRSTRVRISKDKHGWRPDVDPTQAVYALVHFRAEIIYYHPDGRLSINMHGWDTVTTKRRVSQHSGASVSSHRGVMWLGGYGWGAPIDSCEEYFVDLLNRTVTGPDGVVVQDSVRTHSPRPIPKGRDPLNKPLVGDLFRSPEGKPYIVVQERFRESLTLAEYLGDIPACPLYSAVGTGRIPMDNLFLLTMDGWTVDNRFPLKKPEVSHGA